jgi:hypothetical protein
MARFFALKCLSRPCATALFVAALVGCGQGPKVTQYEVPKEPTPDRMLAALVPHGSEAWSFKMTGPVDAVGKCTDKFDALVQTVTFPDPAGGEPQWILPGGWTQEAGGAQLRFATVRIPDSQSPLELTVAKVSWGSGDETQEILANVNRWRGQMQLTPISAEDLSDETRALKLTADQSKAIVVDLAGRLKAGGMSPPFASAAKGDLPTGHPPVGEKTVGAKAAAGESAAAKKSTQVAVDPNLPFTCDLPAGWQPAPLRTFSVATFAVEKDSQKVEVTVTPFGGGAGGLLMNVNRWRNQVHLPPVSEGELESLLNAYKVAGRPAQMVRLFSPKNAEAPLAIVAVVADRDETTWFFRMSGPPEFVEDEQPHFDKFMASIKFK